MKRIIKAASRSPRTANMWKVLETMGWEKPTFVDPTVDGYAMKWGKKPFTKYMFTPYLTAEVLCDEYQVDDTTRQAVMDDPSRSGFRIAEMLTGEKFRFGKTSSKFDQILEEVGDRYREISRDPEITAHAQQLVEDTLQEIYDKTGVRCTIGRTGYLTIPYGE